MSVMTRLTLLLAVSALSASAQNAPTQTSPGSAPAKQHCAINPPPALTDADTAYSAGNAAAAEALWSAKLVSAPSIDAYAGVIRSQLEQNKLTEALASSKAVLAAFPNDARTYSLGGDVLIRLGHIPEASAASSKALSINQCSARAHFGWGVVNGMGSHHDIELHELNAAHALAPSDPEITLAWIKSRPAPERAPPLAALLATHPNLPPDTVSRLQTELAILQQGKLCHAASEAPNATLPLSPIPYEGHYTRGWALKLTMNQLPLALVELDSSVAGIILNPKDAAKAGVQPIGPPPASPSAIYTAVADSIKIGNIEFHDCPVRVAPSNDLADGNSVIGTDFFRDHVIHIDYVAETVTLTPLPATPSVPDKEWTPVYIKDATILVPTLLDKTGPFLFVLDTGSYSSLLSPAIVSRLFKTATDSTVDRIGYSGDFVKILPHEGGVNTDRADIYGPQGNPLKVSRPARLPSFRFATSETADTSILSFDLSPMSHALGTEVTGFIGFRVLQQYSIDLNYRDGLARIVFDQNRRYVQREADKQHVPANF